VLLCGATDERGRTGRPVLLLWFRGHRGLAPSSLCCRSIASHNSFVPVWANDVCSSLFFLMHFQPFPMSSNLFYVFWYVCSNVFSLVVAVLLEPEINLGVSAKWICTGEFHFICISSRSFARITMRFAHFVKQHYILLISRLYYLVSLSCRVFHVTDAVQGYLGSVQYKAHIYP